ncbi:MAG: zinc-ribbon domain-containing protein [Patescibacteria group bacterium]
MEEYQDRSLKCKDCGREFPWTASEQRFFASKGFKNKPARCKDCRELNRQKIDAEYFKITCANCQTVGEVLFKPKNPQADIYCKPCFEQKFLAGSRTNP